MRLERDYQPKLIARIEEMFPGAIVRKHDMQQGFPDLLILWGPHWALLEVKKKRPTSAKDFEANQEWWIDYFDGMSFSACIYPENEEEVLHDLQRAFQVRRPARASKRK